MSMRTLSIKRSLVDAGLRQKNALPFRIFGANKLSSPISSRRYESTLSASQWTQHSLKATNLSGPQSPIISKSPDDGGKKHTAYIALGSNLGDRVGWIEKACTEMSKKGITVKRTSSLWETEPMYVTDQDNFINGACEVSFGDFI